MTHATSSRRRRGHVVSGERRSAGARGRRLRRRRRVTAPRGAIQAIVAPHAGIMFSGPVGACAYKAAARARTTTSRCWSARRISSPSTASRCIPRARSPARSVRSPSTRRRRRRSAAADVVRASPSVHAREHSLEMQLPFLGRLFPGLPIVPLLMGQQSRRTIETSGAARSPMASRRAGRCSSPAPTCRTTSTRRPRESSMGKCATAIAAFDPERLLDVFERYPEGERGRHVGCGIGPAIAVMMAARALGARAGARACATRIRARCRATTTASSATWPRRSGTFDAE